MLGAALDDDDVIGSEVDAAIASWGKWEWIILRRDSPYFLAQSCCHLVSLIRCSIVDNCVCEWAQARRCSTISSEMSSLALNRWTTRLPNFSITCQCRQLISAVLSTFPSPVILKGFMRDFAGICVCLASGMQYCSKYSGSQRLQQVTQGFGVQWAQPRGVVESQWRWSLIAD